MTDCFCVLPWYSKEILAKRVTPCCLLDKSVDINLIKQDLLNNIQTPGCDKCWTVESAGETSRRQQENIFLDSRLNRDIQKIRQDCVNGTNELLVYQIIHSNLCNQACVSCSSLFSTKWAEIDKRMGTIPSSLIQDGIARAKINYRSAKKISLLGGEPLIDPATFKMLEQLILHNNTDCTISIITNGSISLTQQHLKLFQLFSNLTICVSIDGIGPVFEYLRWPGIWNQVISNIKQYRTVARYVSVSYTISSLNAVYYDETVAWFNQNNLPFNHNVVSSPSWLSLKNMPNSFKQHLMTKQNFVSKFCNITNSEISTNDMLYYINQQDEAKKISIQNYLPEVWKLLCADNL